ncbi:beta-glucosidase precursor [Piromyces finnis]|uniref:beta-glucosidase n=1 Tax=Piromyces finnis TaxID=1754191 RepID=A0A1Y1V475_9FUNG|nr:beta-glucosidase precursor [Piromyces finnis]|eukprot:ORX46881.1 beta-glucosidase precursor [Piromyces finnis]
MKVQNILVALSCGLFSQVLATSWSEADQKAKTFMSDLSESEKIDIVTGYLNMQGTCVGNIKPLDRKNFKGLCLQDGPAGVRFNGGTSTTWQAGINSAATFNKELLYQIGKDQGAEFYAKGINVALAPSMNILRAPASGRVWENFGEDPYLSGVCGTQITKGYQDSGVIVAAKHFVANDVEHNREASTSNMDEQTLMEIHIEPFYRTIKDGDAGSVMASYNAVNDVYVVQNKKILTEILKEQIGFQGFVMSDWWAIHDLEGSFNAGMDMNMPGGKAWGPDYINNSFWGSNISTAIKNGKVNKSRLDDAVNRIIRTLYRFDQMSGYPNVNLKAQSMHADTNRQAAIESTILLKNADSILPLTKKYKKIAIIGKDADKAQSCGDTACTNGNIIQGWGSGTTDFVGVTDPYSSIKSRASKEGITVVSSISDSSSEGANAAKDADVAVVFVRADSGEEYIVVDNNKGDRNNLDLWHGGNDLVKSVAAVNKNTIVVIHAPATVNLPFLNNVKAVIHAGMPGAESGNAIASVLFGDSNPSGHLPFTWAAREDYCCDVAYPAELTKGGNQKTAYDYKEGLFVGYRWFDKKNKTPIFPFGHGLSYTTFDYSDLSVSLKKSGTDVTGLEATLTVENTGSVEGATVPMLFLGFPAVSELGDYPIRGLKAFEKVNLKAGQKKTVTLSVDQHGLSYYNTSKKSFVVPTGGEYTVYVGKSAGDLPLKVAIKNTQGTNEGSSTAGGNNNNNNQNNDCSVDGYKCCANSNADVVYTDSTGKWGIENGNWCIIKEQQQQASCFSVALGYPCCSGNNVVYSDSDGKWGFENNSWCGIAEKQSSGCSYSSKDGYPVCKTTTTVVYTDSEKWGVENGNWCVMCRN